MTKKNIGLGKKAPKRRQSIRGEIVTMTEYHYRQTIEDIDDRLYVMEAMINHTKKCKQTGEHYMKCKIQKLCKEIKVSLGD